TAKFMDKDRIAGFKAGGDDYITKPFNMEELLLRIEVFLKRTRDSKQIKDKVIKLGENAVFDYQNLKLSVNDEVRILTQKEADLIKYLLQNANKIIKREDVLMNVWGKDDYFLGRSMDVFMTKIRKYIKDVPVLDLQTVHGIGFNLEFKNKVSKIHK
ncbi:MAG TPA: response regulator transcription factor, partial [Pedobacter sp.]